MGRVIYSLSVSLDGYGETAAGAIDWTAPSDELFAFLSDQVRALGTLMHGRRMYELMADAWPAIGRDPSAAPPMADFARLWTETPKVVVSTTLESVDWNSRLIRGGVAEEVMRLKAEPGDIGVGGPTLASTLVQLDLIDEYRLFVIPIILGGGLPYLPPSAPRIDLRLIETRTFESRVVYLRYERSGGI